MSAKEDRRDMLHLRTMLEQEWCFDMKVGGHRSVRETAILSRLPRDQGGLGYEISQSAVKGLLRGYFERMRDTLEESPEERMAQELADLDMQHRAVAALASTIDAAATVRAAAILGVQTDDPVAIVLRPQRDILAALAQMRAIGERRAKLLGLDAETKTRVTVEHTTELDEAVKKLAAELDA